MVCWQVAFNNNSSSSVNFSSSNISTVISFSFNLGILGIFIKGVLTPGILSSFLSYSSLTFGNLI